MAPDPPRRDVPGVARDPSSINAILEDLRRDGYPSDLAPAGRDRPGFVHCPACDRASDAARFAVAALRRLEGASDPDEEVLIAALRCPECGTGGALVLTYGPEVTETDAAILERLGDPEPPRA